MVEHRALPAIATARWLTTLAPSVNMTTSQYAWGLCACMQASPGAFAVSTGGACFMPVKAKKKLD